MRLFCLCPTAPTADADLVNLSYLNSFGYTKGPKVKHLLWGSCLLGANHADNVYDDDVTSNTRWINSIDGTSYKSNHGTWSNTSGWTYNWTVGYLSSEPYKENYMQTIVDGKGGKISDYDAIACITGNGDTNNFPVIRIIPTWKLKWFKQLMSLYNDTSKYNSDFNEERCMRISESPADWRINVVFSINDSNGRIFNYYKEDCWLNSIWGLKF